MWYSHLDRTEFLQMLYTEIPSLEDVEVRIGKIVIGDEGNQVTLIFDMPRYVDFPPHKWKGHNTAVVEADFFGISKLEISTTSNTYRGTIAINENAEGLLEISIRGNLTANIVAHSGFIQRITACLSE